MLTWVCGAVARWVGELFSSMLSRASSLEMACCRSCTTVGTRGQSWMAGLGGGEGPNHQAQGLTASQVLVLYFQAGDADGQLAVVSTRPTRGPRP